MSDIGNLLRAGAAVRPPPRPSHTGTRKSSPAPASRADRPIAVFMKQVNMLPGELRPRGGPKRKNTARSKLNVDHYANNRRTRSRVSCLRPAPHPAGLATSRTRQSPGQALVSSVAGSVAAPMDRLDLAAPDSSGAGQGAIGHTALRAPPEGQPTAPLDALMESRIDREIPSAILPTSFATPGSLMHCGVIGGALD